MTLKELEIGKSAVILAVGGEGALRQHFLDMGLIPGAEVTLVKYAPMGDPMQLKIRGYELTLRLADAEQIEVRQEENASARTGRGRKVSCEGGRAPAPGGSTAHVCAGRKPELRQDDVF